MKRDRRTIVTCLSLALLIAAATAGSGCGGPREGSQAAVPEEVQKKTTEMLNNMSKDMAAKHANDPKGRGPRRRP
jgi:hypothetical protein